jgi:type III restriction enzyme
MKLKFKKQLFQTEAVNAVADCFADQPRSESVSYRIDPGVRTAKTTPVPRKLYPGPAVDLTVRLQKL